ncbi:hypothetical protein SLEP1_g10958 [Rubroshorea leprosula]|uniref:Reverse transcriptase Ty1/copia-type domain-containing protein n=1 Tax=Rubroshorea leprosula TaxID=152421 RepID=A0AAV5IHP3_9ROSI|nr:hypothetical protein SLEP1_g10958 [Rubroshorea leprosula]
MDEKMKALERNQTWELVDLPKDNKVVTLKWFDVKLAFLNGFLEEDVYVQQSQGYEIEGQEQKVYKLKKAPQAWYKRINAHFCSHGFRKSPSEPTLYVQTRGGDEFSLNDGEEKVDVHAYRNLIVSLLYLKNGRPNIAFAISVLSHFIVISWSSKKQAFTALSSSEVEYISLTVAACQVTWTRRILEDMKQLLVKPTTIFCDNQSTIAMTKNPIFQSQTCHIKTRHHFIRELVASGSLEVVHCNSKDQVVDIFTKPLPLDKFIHLRDLLGVFKISALRGSMLRYNAEMGLCLVVNLWFTCLQDNLQHLVY